jgi:hypothetical protein
MGFEFTEDDYSEKPDCKQPVKPAVIPAQFLHKAQLEFVADAVCPVCFKQIENPVVMAEGPDGKGRRLRTYFGYCNICHAAHVVIQFAHEGRWIIHKFRPAVVVGTANVIEISNNWKLMSELPLTKNSRSEMLDTGKMDALIKIYKAMKSCCVTIELLIKSMAEKRGIDG